MLWDDEHRWPWIRIAVRRCLAESPLTEEGNREVGETVFRALLDAAVAEARRRGAQRLTLRVLGPNAGARRLYEAAGFVVEGTLRGEFVLDGGLVDDVLMARSLS